MKHRQQEEMRRRNAALEQGYYQPNQAGSARHDAAASPSAEANLDPAPTRHAPDSEGQQMREKSKYEASEPYISKKGDRFS